MTVRELIEALQKVDHRLPVIFGIAPVDMVEVREIGEWIEDYGGNYRSVVMLSSKEIQ